MLCDIMQLQHRLWDLKSEGKHSFLQGQQVSYLRGLFITETRKKAINSSSIFLSRYMFQSLHWLV